MRDLLTKLDGLVAETTLDDLKKLPLADDPVIAKAIKDKEHEEDDEDIEESGLQYYIGKKKYGKDGMKKLAQAGRDGASEEELGKIKDQYKKEGFEIGDIFGISISEDFEIGTTIVDLIEDGIVIELDKSALEYLAQQGFTFEEGELVEEKQKGLDGKACWKGYRRMGTKMKGGRRVDNCVKVGESLAEDLSNYTDAGIPAEFAKNMLRKFQINHDAEISPVPGKPKTSDIENGDMIINVLPGDNVVAVLKRREYPRFSASYTLYHRLTLVDGEFKSATDTSVAAATKGMAARGKFFRISSEHLRYADSPRRGEKPTDDEVRDRSTNDPLAGSNYDIYSYMNDTFMPKMKQKMEAMVDDIYANLRKLSNSRDNFRGSKTEQQQALDMAKAIEGIADRGFSRSTMELFLRSMDKEHHGFGSIPNNERELRDILKNEPNARAKWAKTVLAAAQAHHNAVKNMIAAPVMNALRGEDLDEAEYQGRKVPLGKPMKGDVKKSKVYVKNPKTGNVIKINFGDKKMRIKKSNPKRRKSFRARHNCATAKDRTTARYWSCRSW